MSNDKLEQKLEYLELVSGGDMLLISTDSLQDLCKSIEEDLGIRKKQRVYTEVVKCNECFDHNKIAESVAKVFTKEVKPFDTLGTVITLDKDNVPSSPLTFKERLECAIKDEHPYHVLYAKRKEGKTEAINQVTLSNSDIYVVGENGTIGKMYDLHVQYYSSHKLFKILEGVDFTNTIFIFEHEGGKPTEKLLDSLKSTRNYKKIIVMRNALSNT